MISSSVETPTNPGIDPRTIPSCATFFFFRWIYGCEEGKKYGVLSRPYSAPTMSRVQFEGIYPSDPPIALIRTPPRMSVMVVKPPTKSPLPEAV